MNMRVAVGVSAAVLLSCAVLLAQDNDLDLDIEEDTPILLVGCVQRETDYRRQNDAGRGGFLGFGGGLGDEYVLVNASRGAAGPSGDCTTATGGEAFELTGSAEEVLDRFVGQRVAIGGLLKEAEVDPATGRPTGGRQVGDDLRLFEVEIQSFRALADARPTDTLARAEPAREPAPRQRGTFEQERAPVGTAGAQDDRAAADVDQERLPRTASPLALIGLLGLLSLGGAAGMRALYGRRFR